MEKFSQWRDGATGIAPFLPPTKPISFDSKVLNLATRSFGIVAFILTLPWVFFNILVYFLIIQFIPIHLIRKLFLKYSLLTSLRLFKIDISFETRNNSLPKKDIIITNFSSPFDPVIYSVIFEDAVFLFPTRSQKFVKFSLTSAILRSISQPTDLSGGIDLDKVIHLNKSKPIIIFIEGTTSNGKGLLPFVCNIPTSITSTIYPISLKYNPSTVTAPIPTSLLAWTYKLLSSQTSISARVKIANKISTTASDNESSINNEISDAICRVGRLRKLGPNLNLESKRQFISAWYKGRS